MHIYRIEIDNFKSFAEKTLIPFEKGFTTISGPNGSGKSNIIDSILFCLGLSSSRTMRAEKLSDLINNLSKRKECKVTITFQKEAGEQNTAEAVEQIKLVKEESDEPLPENYVDLSTGEFIQVARRIKSGSQGYTSTYYLNGETTTLTAIHEVLSRYHISPGTYNVMMQGDVASIVNMSAMERRKIIDEIAGVAEFDRKIEQAQRELELTGANIERNQLLLTELEGRLEQLATERDHALKYKELRDKKTALEATLLSARYIDVKKAIQRANENIAAARKAKEASQAKLDALLAEIITTRQQLQDLSNEVKKKGEDQQIALKKQIEGLKGHIARKEDAIKFMDEKAAENLQRIEQMNTDILRQQQNTETIDAEIAGFAHQLKELQALYQNEAKSHDRLNKQFDALTGSGSELTVKRTEIRNKLTVEEDRRSGHQRTLLDIEAEIKRHQYDIELRQRNRSESSEKLQGLESRHGALQTQIKDLGFEKSAYEAQIHQTQLDYSKTRVALNEALGRFNQLNKEYMVTEARKKAYEEVSFSRAVESVLASGIKGVHGTLAQLGTVDSEFALATEIAMGGRVQNVVVDSDTIAQQGINHLQKSNAGRATFLPMNKIQPYRNLPDLPAAPGVIDFAFNLLSCEAKYDDVFAYALGETLIVEDMEAARPLLRKYRMVTLDGSLLEKSGAMTGGSSHRGKQVQYFTAGSDDEFKALGERLDKAEEEKAALEKKLTAVELKLETIKQEYAELMSRYSKAEGEFETVDIQLKEMGEGAGPDVDVSDIQKEIKVGEKRQAEITAEITAAEAAIDGLTKELTAIEDQLPADQIESIRQEMAEVKFQMDYYDSQIRNVQADVKGKEMEKNYQQVGIEDCHKRIKETESQNETFVKEKTEALEEIKLTELQIKELDAQTSELDEELKKLQQQRDEVQNQLIEQEKQKNICERELEQLDEQILSFKTRKRELEPQLVQLQTELTEAGIDPETIVEEGIPTEEEITGQIQKLTRKMEAMEPVNMLAIEEYDRVVERRNELAEKIQTLNDERDAINLRIASYHELKLAAFMKAYESVDNHFKTIFAELSDGNGHLLLTNPEDPFAGGMAIYAQPRGKKVQRIESMSGGEKSLTSLAFVFSLQRFMPAPFYALDEVDMNLDGINAEKLANMVKREAELAQFVVVSLRKPMLEHSDRTIGVTQKRDGITKVTGVKLHDLEVPTHDSPEEDTKPKKKDKKLAAAS